jgi:transcriptional regulator with XRE-family HTH domain
MRTMNQNPGVRWSCSGGGAVRQNQEYGVELGRWVKARRDTLGMTQEMVWNRMEMPSGESNWITQLEGGRRKHLPAPNYLEGLAQALRVSVTDVLRGAGILPEGTDQPKEHAPGTATIHALVDMIDWTRAPENRANVEGLLRSILERQTAP